jgi:hypothetical protein
MLLTGVPVAGLKLITVATISLAKLVEQLLPKLIE